MVEPNSLSVGTQEDGECRLLSIPRDDLHEILSRCDLTSLVRLSQTCKKLNEIIKDECVWLQRSKCIRITNQVSSDVRKRSLAIHHPKERIRLSFNWDCGKYRQITCLNQRTKYMPWLQLEDSQIWLSQGRLIYAFKRFLHRVESKSPLLKLRGQADDISRFIVKNGHIISGGREGSLSGWTATDGCLLFNEPQAHASDVTDVAYNGSSLIVSSSKDGVLKVWRWSEKCDLSLQTSQSAGDRVWAIALEPNYGNVVCCGTAGLRLEKSPIQLYDLEKCVMTDLWSSNVHHKRGAGILHAIWDDSHTLLTGGYDGTVRMWDIRTSKCTRAWCDPHDVVIYCIASDNNYAVLAGASQHNRVQMWDKRHSKPQQMYFMASSHSSPVYSLAFDPVHLYAALDQSLKMMDFTGHKNKPNDYRGTHQNIITVNSW